MCTHTRNMERTDKSKTQKLYPKSGSYPPGNWVIFSSIFTFQRNDSLVIEKDFPGL